MISKSAGEYLKSNLGSSKIMNLIGPIGLKLQETVFCHSEIQFYN